MQISASIKNSCQQHHFIVSTEGNEKVIAIPAKAEGYGSSVNGGRIAEIHNTLRKGVSVSLKK
ncbi:MAG TPA: hypothetical protein VHN59_18590 [Chitinophagaceae bacterium]|nr:hypothetical protein [Chitinophagaceae bacterium]